MTIGGSAAVTSPAPRCPRSMTRNGSASTCRTTGAPTVRSAPTSAVATATRLVASAGTGSTSRCRLPSKDKIGAIEFDGVYDYAEVWVNGHLVGGRPYGYSSFECPLTPFVKFDGTDNVVAVRVDHSRFADSRWYTGSGIYRHVRLRFTDPLRIAHWGTSVTTPIATASSATVRVETTIDNASPAARDRFARVRGRSARNRRRPVCLVRHDRRARPADAGPEHRRRAARAMVDGVADDVRRAPANSRERHRHRRTSRPRSGFDRSGSIRTTGSSSTNNRSSSRACASITMPAASARRCRRRSGSAAFEH